MPIFATQGSGYVEQDVNARLDYAEDWSSFMGLVPGDVIATSDWVATPNDLVLEDKDLDGTLASVFVRGGTVGGIYRIQNTITTQGGRTDVRYFFLSVADVATAPMPVLQTALFNRFRSIDDFKASNLSFLDNSFPVDGLTDDVIWDNLVAAEADASHELRVFFRPTKVIPDNAKADEIAVLTASGTPFVKEDAYDFDPASWRTDAWGYTLLRQSPVISIDSARMVYPSALGTVLEIPADWIQLDAKYGHLRFVPSGSTMAFGPMSGLVMSAMAAGRVIPAALQLHYTAGLEDAKRDYPDLVKLVQRMAVLRILKGAYLPQSGSISADGLSQSQSIDVEKWQDGVDRDLANLRDTIKGIRMDVL